MYGATSRQPVDFELRIVRAVRAAFSESCARPAALYPRTTTTCRAGAAHLQPARL